MKKTYINPTTKIHEMITKNILTSSLTEMGDELIINPSTDPESGDAEEAVSREDDFDWTTMIMIFVFSLFGLSVSAQTITTVSPAGPPSDGKKHAMTLYLQGGGTVIYNDVSAIDHVTYLPGIGMKVYTVANGGTSVDYLFSQLTKIDYVEDNNSNANWKTTENLWTNYPEAWRLEYPKLNSNVSTTGNATNCQIIVKKTDDYGITYSLEWDNALKANRWTCYELHAGNTLANVGRNDDFKTDPEVFNCSQASDYSNSGFSRGHLCPSADRLCSKDQNKQTFFLSNMQPQYQSHNGGLWSRLEDQVRKYATDDSYTGSHCDTMYVVKAATIADVASDALTGNATSGVYNKTEVDNYDKLLVPRYFYMALLHYNKESDTYHAIAFWTKHLSTTQPVANLGDYAISINKLEQLTGLDFFCNLPDEVETAVEATEPDLDFWKITKTNQ